ncbi:MAG: hypothetical protein NXH75_11300 [Halobacteriovoraceae bacterium]|nr:hypothetical protein [Halobacteriovoraceae bacterium]
MMKLISILVLVVLSGCSTFAPTEKISPYGNPKKSKVPEGEREDVREIFERDYKSSLKGCFDLETFAESYRVTLVIKIRSKGKVGSIKLKDKASFKMSKSLRQCLKHHKKMIELPKETKRQELELYLEG